MQELACHPALRATTLATAEPKYKCDEPSALGRPGAPSRSGGGAQPPLPMPGACAADLASYNEVRLQKQRSARSVKLQRANLLHVLLVRFLLEKVRGLWSCGRGSGIVVFGKIADLVCSLADLLDDLRLLLRRGFEAQRHALRVLQTIQNAFRLHLQNVDGVHHTEAHDDLAEDGGDQWGQQVRGLLNAEAGAELANVFV
mmetsp:Transcript_58432/g.167719  ORF Transcript_58432/g.167719 Transcript_58432/m.167719 type:complete len:200 (+) Transcript_58432:68-667(+)